MFDFELHQDQELAAAVNGLACVAWMYLMFASNFLYIKMEWLPSLGY